MVCKFCNTQVDENFEFCPNCGAKVHSDAQPENGSAQQNAAPYQPNVAPVQQPGVWDLFKSVFSSNMFLIICILMSVSPVVSIISSAMINIQTLIGSLISSILVILIVVSMWRLYFAASQNGGLMPMASSFNTIKVVVTIQWIFIWISVALVGIAALICLAGSSFIHDIINEISRDLDYEAAAILRDVSGLIGGVFFLVLAITDAIIILINIFFIGNARKCTASFADTAGFARFAFNKLGVVQGWLMVSGICTAITAVSAATINIWSCISTACSAVAYIMMSVMLGNIKNLTHCR